LASYALLLGRGELAAPCALRKSSATSAADA
jgi:hypothetical protein